MEQFDKFTYILIRTPKKKPGSELRYSTRPLGILLSKKHFITISQERHQSIQTLKQHGFTPNGIQPVLSLFVVTAKEYLLGLKEISKELYATQEELQKTAANKDIVQLLELEKSLVFFGTALKANQLIAEKIARSKTIKQSKHNRDLIDDILSEIKQAQNMTKIYSIIISEMTNAISSIISNNLNKRIELLTIVTIILMLPTLLASIYGMNIDLPFQYHPNAFIILMGISIILSLLGALIFWGRKVL